MTPAKVRLAVASMGKPDTKVSELCEELGISRQTLYRHVSPRAGPASSSSGSPTSRDSRTDLDRQRSPSCRAQPS
jgi:transposase-like protein